MRTKRDKKDKESRKGPRFERLLSCLFARFENKPLFLITQFSPLMVGTLVAARTDIPKSTALVILILALALAVRTKEIVSLRFQSLGKRAKKCMIFIGQFALLFAYFSVTEHSFASQLYILLVFLTFILSELEPVSPRQLILFCVGLLCQMSLFSLFAVFHQLGHFFFGTFVLGCIPAFLLAASLIVERVEVLESSGWKRQYRIQNRKGREVLRPGGASRLLSVFLMVGPAIAVIIVLPPLTLLPTTFALVAVLLFLTPDLATGFLRKTEEDKALARRILELAAISSVLMLLIGFIS